MDEKAAPIVFSEWLKRRRKALDMTQEELAKRAACSVGALRKIEAGDRRPSKQLAALLAQALEIPNEDQQTFIRVARGELNLERLQRPDLENLTPISDLWTLRQSQLSVSPGAGHQVPASSNSLPAQAMPLIGREAELASMERLFNDPQCRILTLTGLGGIGKTRLAIEFAASCPSLFPGGVFYIPLTSVNSPAKIVPAIADVLDFGFSGPGEPKEQLLNYLSGHIKQKALLVLDNLEHLIARDPAQEDEIDVVELVSEILKRLPNVAILGTSRERLNLHGEWTYELHGLSIPPANFAGRVEEYKSIALFVNSAQRINANFQVTAEEKGFVVQICQLVEGVPLAIELAAAWVGVLSCREIAQEIQSNMDFLTTSMRDIPERHRSIRATFDHSWKLLTDEECSALCQLSVFQGGFDRNAAFQIAGAALPLLASLSAKSLVRRTESGRYDLHEVIRQYALSHLHDDPRNLATYERYCDYYLRLVADREKALKSAPQQEAIRQLTDEIDNIRAAWVWAINHKKYAQLGQAGRAFGWYFEIAGLLSEGIEQLESLVQFLKAESPDNPWQRVLGLALIHQALLYFRKGEFDQARKLYEESLVVLRPIGDPTLLADALIFLGIILHHSGDYTRAKSVLEEGLVFAQAGNQQWFEAFAIYNLGYIACLKGCSSEGYERMLTGLATWRTLGDPHSIALGLNFLVPVLNRLGLYKEARAFMQESIALCEQTKNRWGMGTAYSFLGEVYIAEGQYAEAKIQLLKSLEIFSEYTTGWNIARTLTSLGHAARMAGEYSEARDNYLDALHVSNEAEAIPIALDALLGLSILQGQAGKTENALMLCYFILDHPSSEEETKDCAGQLCTDLEHQLTSKQLQEARIQAHEMTLDRIVSKVLESTSVAGK